MFESRMIDEFRTMLSDFLPSLGWALVIFLGGIIIGEVLKSITQKFFHYSMLNRTLQRLKLSTGFIGIPIDVLVPEIVKWYIVIAFLSQSFAVLNLRDVNVAVGQLRDFIPTLTKAGLVIYLGMLAGEYAREEIKKSNIPQGNVAGLIVHGAVVYLAAAMALAELYPQGVMVLNIVLAVTLSAIGFGIALGVGLAFGLGTKDVVAAFAKKYVKPK